MLSVCVLIYISDDALHTTEELLSCATI